MKTKIVAVNDSVVTVQFSADAWTPNAGQTWEISRQGRSVVYRRTDIYDNNREYTLCAKLERVGSPISLPGGITLVSAVRREYRRRMSSERRDRAAA